MATPSRLTCAACHAFNQPMPGADGDHVEHSFDLAGRMHDPRRMHVQRSAVGNRRVVVRRGVFAFDEQNRLALEVGRIDDRVLGQRVALWHSDVVERHAGQRLRDEHVGIRDRWVHEADAEASVAEVFEDPQRREGRRSDGDGRMGFVKLAGCRQRGVLAAVAVAQRQWLVGRVGRAAQRFGEAREPIDCSQRGTRLVQQPSARGSEVDTSRGSLEQLHAELLLELADPLRQRGSGHVQTCGSASEVLLLGDRHEVGQSPQIHVRTVAARVVIMTERDMIHVAAGRGLLPCQLGQSTA